MVLLIQNVTASYRRGLILNQINTVGMDLVDDLRFSIQNATSGSIVRMCELYYNTDATSDSKRACKEDNGNSFVSVVKKADVIVGGKTIGTEMPVYGAFCTGTYTFIWNSGYLLEQPEYAEPGNPLWREVKDGTGNVNAVVLSRSDAADPLTDTLYPKSGESKLRLLRVYDTERTVCVNAMKAQDASPENDQYVKSGDYEQSKIPEAFLINPAMIKLDGSRDKSDMVELLNKSGDSDLVLYDLYVAEPAFSETRNNFFFAVSFILGTRRGGINITEAGNSCKPPSDEFSELDYCAINKFNFAVQAGGA